MKLRIVVTAILFHLAALAAFSQTTVFTFQGSLKDAGVQANGNYDFQFALFDAVSGGTQLGFTLAMPSVAVTNGVYSVRLDFGSQFPGANRYLEIRVRQTGQPGFTFLTPRQPVDSAPYSVRSLNAGTADNANNASQLGGLAPSQFLQNTTGTPQSFNFNITGSGLMSGSLGLGTLSPQTKLEVFTPTSNYGFSHTDGTSRLSTFVGPGSFGTAGGWLGTVSNHPLFFFTNNTSPRLTIGTDGNVGVGTATPQSKFEVQTATTSYGLTHTDGTVTVGSFVGGGTGGGYFGTKSNHSFSLFANNNPASLTVNTDGTVSIIFMASGGGAALCRNGFAISFCSSSLRYKTNIGQYSEGMSFINKLHPISFDWKKNGEKDIGFGAEDIEKVDPRFVTYNYEGQVEGVKYDRLSVAFVNAFKEQQTQIETQQKQIEALTQALCSVKPDLDLCQHNK